MSTRFFAIASAVAFAGAMAGCQGSFDAPRLNNPRDPANGQLPPTPSASAQAQPCGPPPTVLVSWTIADANGVIGFQIYRAASTGEDPGILIASVDGAQRQITDGSLSGVPDLNERTTYFYRVRALAGGGIPGLRSNPVAVTTSDCP